MLKDGDLQLIKEEEQERDFDVVTYSFESQGKRKITSKDTLKKLGIRSPDFVDTNVMFASIVSHFPKYHGKRPRFEDDYKPITRNNSFGSEPEYASIEGEEHIDYYGREM